MPAGGEAGASVIETTRAALPPTASEEKDDD